MRRRRGRARTAARRASAAICAAAAAGAEVLFDKHRAGALAPVTNIAKVGGSKHLSPAVFRRDGVVRYSALERTVIVTLHMSEIDDVGDDTRRPALHDGRSDEVFHQRATRWWGLGAADHRRRTAATSNGELPRDVERLIAIQKGTYTILGAWNLADEQWRRDGGSWMFVTETPIGEWRGLQLDWEEATHSGGSMIWSQDIRSRL